jgi:superfamily II DNA or RNA helicase
MPNATDHTTTAATDERLRLRFDWNAVPDRVVIALLKAVYANEPEALDALADAEHRRAQADRVFGTPMSLKALARHEGAWEALCNEWLLKEASKEQLADIAAFVRRSLSGRARSVNLNSRAALRTFFRDRSDTENLRRNVLRGFRTAHRTKQKPRTCSVGAGSRGGVPSSIVRLVGEGSPSTRPLYVHQVEAIDQLRLLAQATGSMNRRGLVVIPTGGGKTVTAVTWILEQMEADPEIRVLWIAHHEELLTQARDTFLSAARHHPRGFERSVRVIAGGHSPVSTLGDDDLDLAIVTVQSLHRSWPTTRRLVAGYLARPTIVVIDEAHHAGAHTYHEIVSEVVREPRSILIGLTATPYPTASLSAARLRDSFCRTLVDVSAEPLHAQGILAVPYLHTIQTHQSLELTPAELKKAKGDLPPQVLAHLQNAARDSLVTRLWSDRKAEWGKTLVFATSRTHGDSLGHQFASAGVPVKVLHGAVPEARGDVLAWFKDHSDPCVLVSVDMLTEGVDVPAAKTAFLVRPTTSPIRLRQMIGRVLRGPAAGGTSEAHVVYFRDNWTNFEDVLDPVELRDIPLAPTGGEVEHRLPPIIDWIGHDPIGEDILAGVWRMYQRRTDRIPLDPATSNTNLCGYYVTMDRNVPVMEHQADGFRDLIARSLKGETFHGTPLQSLFDDTFPPYPTDRSLAAIRAHISATGLEPDFVAIQASINPHEVAQRLRAEEALTDEQREAWLLMEYETSLARIAYPTFEHFEEAVERELRELRQAQRPQGSRLNAERPAAPLTTHEHLPLLLCSPDRALPTLASVVAQMRDVLAGEEVLNRLQDADLPTLSWSKRVSKGAWAYWSMRTSGKAAGKPVIRVNVILRAPRTQVSDDVLSYLIFHEMLHDLLPGQGHDAEFRRLEAMWPNSAALDLTLDTLHEQFDMLASARSL